MTGSTTNTNFEIKLHWKNLRYELKNVFGKLPDLQSCLFLIGVQELGKGNIEFTKEEKQDLISIGNCKVLSLSDYYVLNGQDQDGWPIWKKNKNIPAMNLKEQDEFLQYHIIQYFLEDGLYNPTT